MNSRIGAVLCFTQVFAAMVCTATADEPRPTFYRGLNLNGPAVVIDGHAWDGKDAKHYVCNDRAFENQNVPLVPSTDPDRALMIRSSRWGGERNRVELTEVPAGLFTVFLYVWEDNNPETFSILLNDRVVDPRYNSGRAGHWDRLGPWVVDVADGAIRLTSQGGAANFSGIEVWRGRYDGKDTSLLHADDIAFFESRIRPLLIKHCYECHSAESKEVQGALLVDSAPTLRKGGSLGPAVVPGDVDHSLLIEAVRYKNKDLQMPPDGKLSDAELADLEHWIRKGAPDPRASATRITQKKIDIAKAREFWSLRPVVDPPLPTETNAAWSKNDLDRFMLAKLEAASIPPTRDADQRTLIRRVTYDLIGLSNQQKTLLKPPWKFQPGSECGTLVSDLFPHIRELMDDICVIRSMKSDDNEHYQATLAIHTGSFFFTRPSFGSWVSYGLGTMNGNLPSFITIAPQLPYAGTQVFDNDFLPAYHQGVRVVPGPTPIPNLNRRTTQETVQELELGLAESFHRRHLQQRGENSELAARIRTFETAFHMQTDAGEVFDLSRESDDTFQLYGLQRGQTDSFGWQCLVARRLAERGVRFIELVDCGSNSAKNWDQHGDMADHGPRAKNIDQPIAGLLKDLRRLGMLDETLVVWTTEFGRTPGIDGAKGRGHHSACFSSWLAGGGVKGGITYGSTDELGATVAENKMHVHDFHATILHLLGIDHARLTYRHAGRDFRLTDVHGNVVNALLA